MPAPFSWGWCSFLLNQGCPNVSLNSFPPWGMVSKLSFRNSSGNLSCRLQVLSGGGNWMCGGHSLSLSSAGPQDRGVGPGMVHWVEWLWRSLIAVHPWQSLRKRDFCPLWSWADHYPPPSFGLLIYDMGTSVPTLQRFYKNCRRPETTKHANCLAQDSGPVTFAYLIAFAWGHSLEQCAKTLSPQCPNLIGGSSSPHYNWV